MQNKRTQIMVLIDGKPDQMIWDKPSDAFYFYRTAHIPYKELRVMEREITTEFGEWQELAAIKEALV